VLGATGEAGMATALFAVPVMPLEVRISMDSFYRNRGAERIDEPIFSHNYLRCDEIAVQKGAVGWRSH
jgi:hypothetical protein